MNYSSHVAKSETLSHAGTMANLLTLREVAARLQISRATLGRLIDAGIIPAIVLVEHPHRRLLRVREEALEAALRHREDLEGRRRDRPNV